MREGDVVVAEVPRREPERPSLLAALRVQPFMEGFALPGEPDRAFDEHPPEDVRGRSAIDRGQAAPDASIGFLGHGARAEGLGKVQDDVPQQPADLQAAWRR